MACGDTAAEDAAAEDGAEDAAAEVEAAVAGAAAEDDDAGEAAEEPVDVGGAEDEPPDEHPAAPTTTAAAAAAPPSLSHNEAEPNITNHPLPMTGMSANARTSRVRPPDQPLHPYDDVLLATVGGRLRHFANGEMESYDLSAA